MNMVKVYPKICIFRDFTTYALMVVFQVLSLEGIYPGIEPEP